MSPKLATFSLTRPTASVAAYVAEPWQFRVGIAMATGGAMLLMALFVLTIVIAGWVSDLNGSEAGNVSLLGRVNTYEAWLLPVAVGAIALAKFGTAVILYGIVRRLWLRVAAVKESLPALVGRGGVK